METFNRENIYVSDREKEAFRLTQLKNKASDPGRYGALTSEQQVELEGLKKKFSELVDSARQRDFEVTARFKDVGQDTAASRTAMPSKEKIDNVRQMPSKGNDAEKPLTRRTAA
jgi:hypothetical protein